MEILDKGIDIKDRELLKVLEYVSRQRGLDLLSAYRKEFVFRRLRLRMRTTRCSKALEYLELLDKNDEEYNKFLDHLSINVTEFFRDEDVFEYFRKEVLPAIVKKKESSNEQIIRIWSAGCAHGQEPYSISIILRESLDSKKKFFLRIWATDIDSDALRVANRAEYSAQDIKNIDKRIVEKYFNKAYNDIYVLGAEIKHDVFFKRHNLTEEPPLRYIDAVFCRNVMIYFHRQQQELLFKKFHQSLSASGYLIIGKTETIWDRDLFMPVNTQLKIYRKNEVTEKE
ncbi:MAG: protein-glutamate O-methyltransferase CheR [Candidatus Omnitrophota bacterium]